MLNKTLWTEDYAIKPWEMNKKVSKHVNPTDINFSNSKSHTSNCIGKQKQCFWWQQQCLDLKSWSQGGRKEIKDCLVAFLWIFSITKLSNQLEARTTILIIKNNLSNKARFNLNNKNYSVNARKTHINIQRRCWALGLGPTPRATTPQESSVLVQSWIHLH